MLFISIMINKISLEENTIEFGKLTKIYNHKLHNMHVAHYLIAK